MSPELLSYNLGRGVTAFSTRRGTPTVPTDASPYVGFNITHYCGDSAEHVVVCRAALCKTLNISDERLVLPRQTHTTNVYVLDEEYFATFPELRPRLLDDVDALVTRLPGVCIGVSTADCVPVLMADSEAGVIAAVHAGWRGMVQRIVAKSVGAMVRLGASTDRIRVAIGPSIGRESFEVGEEVVDTFMDAGFHPCILTREFPRPHIDLWQACLMQLEECGVAIGSYPAPLARGILCPGIDTFQHPDEWFSARRLGIRSGRIFSGVMLKG